MSAVSAAKVRRGVPETGTASLPGHVAIIMDGNGRWAKQHGMPRFEGHRRGVEAVRRAVAAARVTGIKYLTIYSFSSENWSRPAQEVADLMGLLKLFIRSDLAKLHSENVRVRIIGRRDDLAADLQALLNEAEAATLGNTGLQLIVAFNYGARQEIARAAAGLAKKARAGEIDPDSIDADAISAELLTSGIPDPDLLIRTSGEQRLSNFLLWQCAYAEFVFLPVLWPDFDKSHLEQALAVFSSRERRFGGLSPAAG